MSSQKANSEERSDRRVTPDLRAERDLSDLIVEYSAMKGRLSGVLARFNENDAVFADYLAAMLIEQLLEVVSRHEHTRQS